ncbi:uncharacterized protein LOC108676755 isoform X3 [Hyalella azteca]|uniref:Uncharacterized protein LOC108676755 isoform X3 n=1 Tax=Hyalella azteca TaxID=294128 RepID=A0A8B7P339_HYAAZ|nr:uncharacterized protein LOC108676755 isoform X3 [Hyalella azteca]
MAAGSKTDDRNKTKNKVHGGNQKNAADDNAVDEIVEKTDEERKKDRKAAMMKKAVRIVTVVVYLMGVSGGGFLLSLYYIIFWDPQIEVAKPPQYLSQVQRREMAKRDLMANSFDDFYVDSLHSLPPPAASEREKSSGVGFHPSNSEFMESAKFDSFKELSREKPDARLPFKSVNASDIYSDEANIRNNFQFLREFSKDTEQESEKNIHPTVLKTKDNTFHGERPKTIVLRSLETPSEKLPEMSHDQEVHRKPFKMAHLRSSLKNINNLRPNSNPPNVMSMTEDESEGGSRQSGPEVVQSASTVGTTPRILTTN